MMQPPQKKVRCSAKDKDHIFMKEKKYAISGFVMIWFLFLKLHLLIQSVRNNTLGH